MNVEQIVKERIAEIESEIEHKQERIDNCDVRNIRDIWVLRHAITSLENMRDMNKMIYYNMKDLH